MEARLFEGQNRFDVVYATVTDGGIGATLGIQRGTGTANGFTQFSCNTASVTSGMVLRYDYTLGTCPSPTPTSTFTVTATRTATFTPVPCGPGYNYIME
jgi:hypothetical protein